MDGLGFLGGRYLRQGQRRRRVLMSFDARVGFCCSCNGVPGGRYSRTWSCSDEGRGGEGAEEMKPDPVTVVPEYVYESKGTRKRQRGDARAEGARKSQPFRIVE